MLNDFTRLDRKLKGKRIVVFHIVQKVIANIHMKAKALYRDTEMDSQTVDQLGIIR